jgi:hypothetical protein
MRSHKTSMQLPVQSQPVERDLVSSAAVDGAGGIQPSQDACANLTGLAQQMCYATEYGVSI